LEAIDDLQLSPQGSPKQKLAIEQVIEACQKRVEEFMTSISTISTSPPDANYEPNLEISEDPMSVVQEEGYGAVSYQTEAPYLVHQHAFHFPPSAWASSFKWGSGHHKRSCDATEPDARSSHPELATEFIDETAPMF
jgi:hypothetical protein